MSMISELQAISSREVHVLTVQSQASEYPETTIVIYIYIYIYIYNLVYRDSATKKKQKKQNKSKMIGESSDKFQPISNSLSYDVPLEGGIQIG